MHKFPFKNVIFLAIGCKTYLKIAALVAFKTDHALRREENKVEFLEGRFLDEKLPLIHEKKPERSFELSLSIFCLNLEVQKSGHHRMVIARNQFC